MRIRIAASNRIFRGKEYGSYSKEIGPLTKLDFKDRCSLRVIVILIFTSVVTNIPAICQCHADDFARGCISELSKEYNFIKSFKIDSEDGMKSKVEYSYVFTKGTQYVINICTATNSAEGITMSLFDSGRNKIASNQFNQQPLTALSYACVSTGIYYIQYTFDAKESKCAGSALGFKRLSH